MLVLSKENLIPYLKEHYPSFDLSGPVTLSAVGDPDGELPADGLVNYVFKVRTIRSSVIVKQGQEYLRIGGAHKIPPDRNRLEYETIKLRGILTPQYAPELYYVDMENHIFIMEDVSYLPSSTYQFSDGVIMPLYGRQCGEFIASSVFYTSELYLDKESFRSLACAFTNSGMRNIMETWLFLRIHGFSPNPLCADFNQYVGEDEAVVAQCYLLRHQYMTNAQALIHGDLHTANIFADQTRMKVIDMEYTFAGPYAYDVGYLMNNLVSHYCSAAFRPFSSEEARTVYKAYMLQTIRDLYNSFVGHFTQYWEQDAQPIYRAQAGFRRLLTDGFLPDVIGFASVPGLCRGLSEQGYKELELVTDPEMRRYAYQFFMILERHLLLNRNTYPSIEAFTDEIVRLEEIFRRHM